MRTGGSLNSQELFLHVSHIPAMKEKGLTGILLRLAASLSENANLSH